MMVASAIELMERGLCPDAVTRWGIRRLCDKRVRDSQRYSPDGLEETRRFVEFMRDFPVSVATQEANAQHYELPPEFFHHFLGPRHKYSCCYWEPDVLDLAAAEKRSLAITCERAGIQDGDSILELGCGWGSLTLYMAEHFPSSRIVALSNSASQRNYITEQLRTHNLMHRVDVVTADVKEFTPVGKFQRIVSVEMLEHMRNYPRLLRSIASWLEPRGSLFVHIFCHRSYPYFFESHGAANWMGRYFFTGGTMPSFDLLRYCHDDLQVETAWSWNGKHYTKTLNAWLHNFDRQRPELLPILETVYGEQEAPRWLQRWRMFLMACAELFAYQDGNEWFVGHFRMGHRGEDPA